MYSLIRIFFCIFCVQYSSAQHFRAERIFLAAEKEACMPGDTLKVSGQVLSSDSRDFDPYSRYVYLECIDQKDSLLSRQKVACNERGYFYSAVPTQLEWRSKVCYLRAYTRLMQNYPEESFTVMPFLLGAVQPQKEEPAREIQGRFFPEGGRLIEGFQQNVIFQLTDDAGFPVIPARSLLLDEKNDTIVQSVSLSSHGLGKLIFQPQAGKQYRLQTEYDNRLFTFPIQTNQNGASLQAIVNRSRLSCRILSTLADDNFRLFLYHPDKGLQEIPLQPKQKAAIIDLSDYPQGLLALFLMDTENHLLSERLLWHIPSESESQKPETSFTCILPQTCFSPGESLNYRLVLPDNSSCFIRVVPHNDLLATQAYLALWLGNDVLSPVRFPLTNSEELVKHPAEWMDWLCTARFVRFSPEKILKDGMLYPFPIEDGLFIAGTAWKNENKPFGPGLIEAWNKKDLSTYTAEIDTQGRFILPVDNYADGTAFRLNAKNSKGKQVDCSFILEEETFPEIKAPHFFTLPDRLQTDVLLGDTGIRYSTDEYNQKVYHIDNITVQSRRPMHIHEMKRTPNNFIGEDILIKRSGQSVRSLLNRFTAITILKNSTGSGGGQLGILKQQNRYKKDGKRASQNVEREYGETTIAWKSGKHSFLSATPVPLNVVVNGELIMGSIDYILEWTAGNLKSIELIRPNDSRCALYGTPMGAIVIETLSDPHTYDADEPQGQTICPRGLFIARERPAAQAKAPSRPGRYRLLVDVVTGDRRVVSFSREFEVK